MKTLLLSSTCSALVASAFLGSPTAHAATTSFDDFQQPAGVCQPAREYPDLRVRQIEIDNIGTTNAYVVCAPNHHYVNGNTTRIYIAFQNAGDTERTIKCTLHNQYMGGGSELNSVVREVVVGAGEQSSIDWEVGEEGLPHLDFTGIQCILPTQTSVGYVYVEYDEEDLAAI